MRSDLLKNYWKCSLWNQSCLEMIRKAGNFLESDLYSPRNLAFCLKNAWNSTGSTSKQKLQSQIAPDPYWPFLINLPALMSYLQFLIIDLISYWQWHPKWWSFPTFFWGGEYEFEVILKFRGQLMSLRSTNILHWPPKWR